MTLSMGVSSAFADTFALVTINQQALFFNQINDGANAAAKAAGVDLVIFNANNVPSAQNDAIENYITQKVDGIILVAIDVNGVKPAITAAKNAGERIVRVCPGCCGDRADTPFACCPSTMPSRALLGKRNFVAI